MRLFPGKENCHVIDMVSSLETGIITTPTLFGLDPGELLEKASVEDMRDMRDRKEAESAREQEAQDSGLRRPAMRGHELAFTEYDSIFDLITDSTGEQHIRSISQYAWVHVAADRYVLSGPGGSYLRIEKVRGSPIRSAHAEIGT
jgi:ATP-dependent helicase IRC3